MRKINEGGKRNDEFRLQNGDLPTNGRQLVARRGFAQRLVGVATLPGRVTELGQQHVDRADLLLETPQVLLGVHLAIVEVEDRLAAGAYDAPGIIKPGAADPDGFTRGKGMVLPFRNFID